MNRSVDLEKKEQKFMMQLFSPVKTKIEKKKVDFKQLSTQVKQIRTKEEEKMLPSTINKNYQLFMEYKNALPSKSLEIQRPDSKGDRTSQKAECKAQKMLAEVLVN